MTQHFERYFENIKDHTSSDDEYIYSTTSTKSSKKKPPPATNHTSVLANPEAIRLELTTDHKMYYISGAQVHFPFTPYPSQLGMMQHMIQALNNAQNTMIESPTGSGKSLALLCAALAWRRDFSAKCRLRLSNARVVVRKYAMYSVALPTTEEMEVVKGEKGDGGDGNGDGDGDEKKPDVTADSTAAADVADDKPDLSAAETEVAFAPDLTADVKPKVDPNTGALVAADMDFVTPAATPEKKTMAQKAEMPTNPTPGSDTKLAKASAEYHRAVAMADLPKTVTHILAAAKIAIPPGLAPEDIATLEEFQKHGSVVSCSPRIYFGSRTHRQVAQLVDELRRKTPYRLRTAVLGSRAQTCIRQKKNTDQSVDDMCRALLDEDNCSAYSGFRKLTGHKKVARGGDMEIWDIEDIVSLGKRLNACPYYAVRELAGTADLVFCPYNYILDPGVREAAGIELEGNIVILDEAHNVENAARDAGSLEVTDQQLGALVGECRQLSNNNVLPLSHEFVGMFAEGLLGWLNDPSSTYEHRDFETQTSVWPKNDVSTKDLFRHLSITPEFVQRLEIETEKLEDYIKEVRAIKEQRKLIDKSAMLQLRTRNNSPDEVDMEEEQQQDKLTLKHLSAGLMRLLSGMVRVLKYTSPASKYHHDYRIAKIKKPNPEYRDKGPQRKRRRKSTLPPPPPPPFVNVMAFWALNPGVVFSEIASYSRSIILTSGTLSPLDSYESELQVYFASKLEASHVIDPARFSAMAIECGPSGLVLEGKYSTVDTFSFQDDVGQALCSIAASSPDGMLVFVTSYALLNKLIARWRMTGHYDELNVHKTVFVEPRGGSKDEFEKLLAEYRRCLASDRLPGQPLARGAVMFAVYRGKVSEGIDFSDFFCRTVVNIGIPYPAFKDVKVMLKREYNDQMYRQYQYHQGSSNGNQAAASTGLLNGSKWYDTQAFRAINQALGRCLRHKNDWGAIIMLESRFGQSWNINRLSKWVRQHLRVHRNFGSAMASLDEFYRVRIQEDQLTFAEMPDIAEVQTPAGDFAGCDSDFDAESNAGSYTCV
ncbi:hypothetical protein LPJ66_002269 [Kickxella alabastrina]|uniref:Uncharacterized protein n=1 Tax=Kickxella alabastrina TaxID=61397 RepID=A0ACC1IQY4_9FUNG|nr:hypothetical protein LPJ66_002269 [Kickxella alabastrina]